MAELTPDLEALLVDVTRAVSTAEILRKEYAQAQLEAMTAKRKYLEALLDDAAAKEEA